MKKIKLFKKIGILAIASVLTAGSAVTLAIATPSAITVQATTQEENVRAFVARFYEQLLGREADQAGLDAWTNQLLSGANAGCDVGYGFLFSEEFTSRNISNNDYVTILYRAFFDREPDAAGANAWVQLLTDGMSRLYVYKGFAESQEFAELCARYGITRGNVPLNNPEDQNAGVTRFIYRLYRICLEREPDAGGLQAWVSNILNGTSPIDVGYGFIYSPEFQGRNLSNTDYVLNLYRTILGREGDSDYLNWVAVLNNGSNSRGKVFHGFVYSQEFQEICNSYGIGLGTPNVNTDGYDDYTPIPNAHEHNWVPVYETKTIVVCGCGEEFPTQAAWEEHQYSYLNVGDFSHPGHHGFVDREVQVGEQCSICGETR